METIMTMCSFYFFPLNTQVQYLGELEFPSFQLARSFLKAVLTENLGVIEAFNGYLGMFCNI